MCSWGPCRLLVRSTDAMDPHRRKWTQREVPMYNYSFEALTVFRSFQNPAAQGAAASGCRLLWRPAFPETLLLNAFRRWPAKR